MVVAHVAIDWERYLQPPKPDDVNFYQRHQENTRRISQSWIGCEFRTTPRVDFSTIKTSCLDKFLYFVKNLSRPIVSHNLLG